MIEIKVQSLISFLDISISKELINSIKKGFGNKLAESLLDFIDDIKTFIKSGLYRDVKGYVAIGNKKEVINYENAVEVLNGVITKITEEVQNRYSLVGMNYEMFCTDLKYSDKIKSKNSIPSLLKEINEIKFNNFKIYTNCGVLHTYHDLIDLNVDCRVTSIQYSNEEVNLIFKNLNHEQLLKIISYHLKNY
jgi:hypothetical protein